MSVSYFTVGFDDYSACPEDEEVISSNGSWWKNAEFTPGEKVAKECKIDEDLLWRCINGKKDENGPQHVLVSGKGGCGKSHLLQRFKDHFVMGKGFNSGLVVTSPTGISAQIIDGETLYQALGLGLAQDDPRKIWRDLSAIKNRSASRCWNFLLKTRVLIIDELSMLDPMLFSTIDWLFQKARGNSLPFGGITLVMFGDFLQLAPVRKDAESEEPRYLFQTNVWEHMNICRLKLNRNYRQKDKDFIDMLDEIRYGEMSVKTMNILRSKLVKSKPVYSTVASNEIEAMTIYAHKVRVDENNSKRLAILCRENKKEIFGPRFTIARRSEDRAYTSKEASDAKKFYSDTAKMDKYFPVVVLEVCEGAQVMMRCNFYRALGIMNGTMGIVTKLTQDAIHVLFSVRGKFLEKPTVISRYAFKYKFCENLDVVLVQFPISLAWSTTMHKVQGLTLDKLSISGNSCFETGQFYVALSRVRSMEDFELLDFRESSIRTDQDAVRFERGLQEETELLEDSILKEEQDSRKKVCV